MPDTEAKLDAVLAKMDELLAAKDKQESKLNAILMKLESLEKSQKKTAQDVYELKDSYKLLDHDVTEVKSALAEKANRKEIDALNKKIEDLENRSKRNNVVIWGLKEGAEKDCSSVEEFLEEELFSKHMGLDNIEVMRAHRTKINQAAASATAPQSRPIHVYLLRYPDKGRILKAAANTLKDNPFCDRQIFISDDVSKSVRSEREANEVKPVVYLGLRVCMIVADGNVEDLETFLLSVQDCICRIAQCTALGNVEYIHDCSEGFV
ncbi:uncharacterized protein LOC113677698 [Pocillopora damicornis]|uniref:uncharacterized protein LOC113677698 n=1 Tax=Pocillopora damicornis TaxID=46731 RepID=UPI000F54CCA7|nr:uncharacterized protein LOC113677698 [Pocillopora damicornis]